MESSTLLTVLGAALCFATVTFAQAPRGAPEGSTGVCKDGTYYSEADATAKGAKPDHGKACS